MVDPVTRAISCSQQAVPTQSDASKVVAKGLGLTKGFIGQKNSFTVDCSKAGMCDSDINIFVVFFKKSVFKCVEQFLCRNPDHTMGHLEHRKIIYIIFFNILDF